MKSSEKAINTKFKRKKEKTTPPPPPPMLTHTQFSNNHMSNVKFYVWLSFEKRSLSPLPPPSPPPPPRLCLQMAVWPTWSLMSDCFFEKKRLTPQPPHTLTPSLQAVVWPAWSLIVLCRNSLLASPGPHVHLDCHLLQPAAQGGSHWRRSCGDGC